MFIVLRGKENTNRLIYSQFYTLIKGPFNILKMYIFDNKSFKKFVLDFKYI